MVRGVFESRSAGRDGDFEGWDDEPSAVVERPEAECKPDAEQDRITSEFPESIEEAVRIASETHLPTAAVPDSSAKPGTPPRGRS